MAIRQTLANLLFAAFLFCCVIPLNTLVAQNGGIKIIDIQVDRNYSDGCNLKFDIIARVANLELQEGQGLEGTPTNSFDPVVGFTSTVGYHLPPNVPDMIFTYRIGSGNEAIIKSIPVETFYATFYPSPPPANVFTWSHTVIEDVSGICNFNPEYVEIIGTLNQSTGGWYLLEPYSGPDEIFQCNVFLETCGYCYFNEDCPVPPQDIATTQARTKTVCQICNNNNESSAYIPQTGSGGLTHNELSATESKVYPNPFTSDFSIDYTLPQVGSVEILIYDASGKLLTHEQIQQDKGFQRKTFTTATWPEGIYFGQLNINGQQQHFRIVKAN